MHNKTQSSSEILLYYYQTSVSYTKHNFHNPEPVAPKINNYLHDVLYFLNRRYNVFPSQTKCFMSLGLNSTVTVYLLFLCMYDFVTTVRLVNCDVV